MMIILSIGTCILAMAILAVALRGRIIQRGTFCRKCRFDLCGLDLGDQAMKCPECGSPVADTAQRRATLRARSKPLLAVAVLLLLLGTSGLYVSVFVDSNILYSYLPDRAVIALAQQGNSVALDEVVTRWSTSGEFNQEQQFELIRTALELQADRTMAWDPRWGQLLRDSIEAQRLSDEQLIAFVTNGYTHKVELRDNIRQGDDRVPYTLKTVGDRVLTTFGGVMPYEHGGYISAWGIKGNDPIREYDPPRRMMPMVLQGPESNDHWMRSTLPIVQGMTDAPIGSQISIYIDIRVLLRDPERPEAIHDRTIRQEHTMTVVAPEEPIVMTTSNATDMQRQLDAIKISPVCTAEYPSSGPSNGTIHFAAFTLIADDLPTALAMRVSFRFGDDVVPVGTFALRTDPGERFAERVAWSVPTSDRPAVEEMIKRHAVLLEAERIDVIMHPDPDLAIVNPEILEVFDSPLIFRDIPVRLLADSEAIRTMGIQEVVYSGEVGHEESPQPQGMPNP